MPGKLPQLQIDQILYAEAVGRLGCHAGGRTYIIPMNYVYDGENIYGYATAGMKLEMMRTNTSVCFQVDQMRNPRFWCHVLAWGLFQELLGEEAACALYMLAQKLTTLIASGQSLHEMRRTELSCDHGPYPKITVYRIHLTKKTGHFGGP